MSKLSITLGVAFIPSNPVQTSINTPTERQEIEMAGEGYVHGVQEIGTTNEAVSFLTLADLSSPGYVLCRNLDLTNYVDLGASSPPTIRLKAKESAIFRLASPTLWAKADGAPCRIEFWVFED